MADPLERRQQMAERFPNVKPIETPEAKYRLIYEDHRFAHNPEVVGNADAFVSEFLREFDYSNPEGARAAVDARWKSFRGRRGTAETPLASRALPAFEERVRQRSFYLCDIVDTSKTLDEFDQQYVGMKTTEMAAGAAAAVYAAQNIAREGITRRKLLQNAIAAALATKGATHMAEAVQGSTDSQKQLTPMQKKLRSISETINPETDALIFTYRNAIWAHKLHRIASEMGSSIYGRKPMIDMLAGNMHSGLEQMLRMDPKKRLNYIQNMTRILSNFYHFGDKGILISPIARFEFSKETDRWEPVSTYRDPELEAIEKEITKK